MLKYLNKYMIPAALVLSYLLQLVTHNPTLLFSFAPDEY